MKRVCRDANLHGNPSLQAHNCNWTDRREVARKMSSTHVSWPLRSDPCTRHQCHLLTGTFWVFQFTDLALVNSVPASPVTSTRRRLHCDMQQYVHSYLFHSNGFVFPRPRAVGKTDVKRYLQPANPPTIQQANQPTSQPTNQTINQPTKQPPYQPANEPQVHPPNQPSTMTTNQQTADGRAFTTSVSYAPQTDAGIPTSLSVWSRRPNYRSCSSKMPPSQRHWRRCVACQNCLDDQTPQQHTGEF